MRYLRIGISPSSGDGSERTAPVGHSDVRHAERVGELADKLARASLATEERIREWQQLEAAAAAAQRKIEELSAELIGIPRDVETPEREMVRHLRKLEVHLRQAKLEVHLRQARAAAAVEQLAALQPGDEVTAISLWEPWASLMALGAKENETRGWRTGHRGPLLICAAKRLVKSELQEYLEDELFQKALAPLAPGRPVTIDDLNFGKAVALTWMSDCVGTKSLIDHSWGVSAKISPQEYRFGNYAPGRFAWRTTAVRRLKPFPVKGKQGLFRVTLPSDVEDWDARSAR